MQPAGQDPEVLRASGTVAVPLRSQPNASPFWIMLLLVSGRLDNRMIRIWQYVAIITNGKGIIPEGTRISVPKNKVKWDNGNPTGHGIMFIGNAGQIYCYVTPGGTASW
jgi:hypothetical protein